MDRKGEKLYCSLAAIMGCPICNEKLTGDIYICGTGHSICCACANAGTFCIRCQAPYTKIPNLVVQNLLSQFDDIKECLMELDDLRMKSHELSIAIAKKENDDRLSETKDVDHPGHYYCWITNECKFIGYVSSIVKHFKHTHPLEFEEISIVNLPYAQTWEMDYLVGTCLNRAIKIGKLLFIIHISINDKGELGSCILMYTSHPIAIQHACKIEIECGNRKLCSRNTKVISLQSSERTILGYKRSGLQIHRNEMLYSALRENVRFKCSLVFEKKDRAIVDNQLSKTFVKKNDNFDTNERKNNQQSSMGFENTNELFTSLNSSEQTSASVVTTKKQFDYLHKKEESLKITIDESRKKEALKINVNKSEHTDNDKKICIKQSKADMQIKADKKNRLVAIAAGQVNQRMKEESSKVRGSVQSGFIYRKGAQISSRKFCQRAHHQPQSIIPKCQESSTEDHDEVKINSATNKQLIKLQSEVDQLAIGNKSNSKNKFEQPPREPMKFTGFQGIIDKQSNTYNQPPQQNQLYPNLDVYANAQSISTNGMPPHAQPMNYNHFNAVDMPSAPYERVPPTNPYFYQQRTNSNDGAQLTQEKKRDDKCTIS